MPHSKIPSRSVILHIPKDVNATIEEFMRDTRKYAFMCHSKLLAAWWAYFQYDTMPVDELAESILNDGNFKKLSSWDYKNANVFEETSIPVQLAIREQMRSVAHIMNVSYQKVVLYCWNQIAYDIRSGLFTYKVFENIDK